MKVYYRQPFWKEMWPFTIYRINDWYDYSIELITFKSYVLVHNDIKDALLDYESEELT